MVASQFTTLTGLTLLPIELVHAQSMMDQMIFERCSAAMQSDFEKAGQTPAAGLIQSTCGCVVKQINATHSIDLAKKIVHTEDECRILMLIPAQVRFSVSAAISCFFQHPVKVWEA